MQIKLCSVAAVALNNVIGAENNLPWNIPSDLKWFKKLTKDHVVIMGRKTWDSLPKKPLPGRYNIVISRQHNNEFQDNTYFTNSLKYALSVGMFEARRRKQQRIFVIGGESIYNAYFNLIDTHYITSVIARPEGDAKYPSLSLQDFTFMQVLDAPAPTDADQFVFEILRYDRIKG